MNETHSFWYKYRYILYTVPVFLIGVFPDNIEKIIGGFIKVFNLNKNTNNLSEIFLLREAIYINIFGTLIFIAASATRFFDSIIKKFSSTNHKNNQIILFNSFSFITIGFVIALTLGVYTKLNFPAHKDIMMMIQKGGEKLFSENDTEINEETIGDVIGKEDILKLLNTTCSEERKETYKFLTAAINFLTITSIYLMIAVILMVFLFEPIIQIFITGYKDIYQKKLPG